ncbi:LUPUS LA PROTEIN-RELATED [Salix koriyanagi]|uniref:LUPUS LA PROTEIN-RELATED n=1 Tax=Salix koriyanagi TaxID=2511006 RepID=A0A9Q0TRV5_9ROSI|nr:LUPUS LA PROTEIN-RELATED [Salix koriyanagi]
MAQAQPEEGMSKEKEMKETTRPKNDSVSFKFNAQAPEFFPRSHATATQMPISGYFYPYFDYLGAPAAGGSDWFFVGNQDHAAYLISNNPNVAMPNCPTKNSDALTDDLRKKIIKQVEYQFSDISLLANESMSKHINKDPEGYVPISVIASTKKMRSLVIDNDSLAQALKSSSKLSLSEDGKKVKRNIPFTDKDREELQSRIVVVENLPEDHSHQNVQKIFSVVGSVKTIRICHPQESTSSGAKNDFFVTNKLHALVELETREMAEKAAEKLNDLRNWRKGLRVRLLLRCSPKSVLPRGRRSEFDIWEEVDSPLYESTADTFKPNISEAVIESQAEGSPGASKKAWAAKGHGKGKGRGQLNCSRGLLAPVKCGSAPQCEASAKNASKGPRMPDGTRGFTVGRGKPLVT